jgi:hypothetical protein
VGVDVERHHPIARFRECHDERQSDVPEAYDSNGHDPAGR